MSETSEVRCPDCLGSGWILNSKEQTFSNCPCSFEKKKLAFLDTLPKIGTPYARERLGGFLRNDPLQKSIYFFGDTSITSENSWGFIKGALRELFRKNMRVLCYTPGDLADRLMQKPDPDDQENTARMKIYTADLLVVILSAGPPSLRWNLIFEMFKQQRDLRGLPTWFIKMLPDNEFKIVYCEAISFFKTLEQMNVSSLKFQAPPKVDSPAKLPEVAPKVLLIDQESIDDSPEGSLPEHNEEPEAGDHPLKPWEIKQLVSGKKNSSSKPKTNRKSK